MTDCYERGFNDGLGESWRNNTHDYCETESDRASYRDGRKEGEYRRRLREEIDRELLEYR